MPVVVVAERNQCSGQPAGNPSSDYRPVGMPQVVATMVAVVADAVDNSDLARAAARHCRQFVGVADSSVAMAEPGSAISKGEVAAAPLLGAELASQLSAVLLALPRQT